MLAIAKEKNSRNKLKTNKNEMNEIKTEMRYYKILKFLQLNIYTATYNCSYQTATYLQAVKLYCNTNTKWLKASTQQIVAFFKQQKQGEFEGIEAEQAACNRQPMKCKSSCENEISVI